MYWTKYSTRYPPWPYCVAPDILPTPYAPFPCLPPCWPLPTPHAPCPLPVKITKRKSFVILVIYGVRKRNSTFVESPSSHIFD